MEPTENTASSATNADNITTRTEIVTFSDSSIVTMTTPQDIPPVPSTPVDPYLKQTLTDYLSRVYFYTNDWPSSAPMGSLLAQLTFPNFLFSVPQIWDKLKNFTYFRAGVKISIRVNGSKFHYGQLLVSYSPQFNNMLDMVGSLNNIYSASGCPSFTVSPSENEVHEFVLPYALPYQYIPMYYLTSRPALGPPGDPAFQFGVVNVHVLNPLSNASGTPTPVTYTIFANFVDVDIAGYNPIAYTIPPRYVRAQSDFPATLPPTPPRPSVSPQLDPIPPFTGAEDPFVAQRATREQTQKSEKGIVGSVLESVSAISGALSFIPEIGVVAAGISAATGGAATVANYFGWTNPISLRAIQPIVQQYTNQTNTHGLIDCMNLAIKPDSIVSPSTQLLGGNGKEMSLLHIAQTPTLLAAGITWTAADTLSTGLYEVAVTPTAEFIASSINRTFPTLLSWVSRSCMSWRGSIRYHVQIVCSQMHVGRLRITFVPLNNYGALDLNQYASTTSMIVDIQQQSSFSFTVPYIHHQPWCRTYASYGNQPIGFVRISVLNDLNHPTVPVPSVYLNVWTSAGPDFQLARPDDQFLRLNWAAASSDPPPETPFVAQGLTRDAIRSMPAPSLIPAHGAKEEQICNADEVHHIKDIIMRPSWIYDMGSIANPSPGSYTFDPYAPIPRIIQPSFTQIDYLSYFRCIFRYSRGGIRAIAEQTQQAGVGSFNSSCLISNTYVERNGPVTGSQYNRVTPGGVVPWVNIMQQFPPGGSAFFTNGMPSTAVMPFYCQNYGITNAGWLGAPTVNTWNTYGNTPALNISFTGSAHLLAAAADDYELIFLVGPPALTSDGS